ncbi:MAG: CTP synthase [Candidatus Andersenbacteria bacterium]
MQPRYIFVTGGVLSGIGKGITAASIGAICKAAGKKVFMQKLERYLNVDAGTMNPFRHGEVFVLDDGTETDLDLGHYERFIDESLSKLSFVTSGAIYWELLQNERRGDYLGRDIQVIPHVTDLVKAKVRTAAKKSGCDVMIIEVGGTVGDMEGNHFLEAARQMHREEGEGRVRFVHVSYLPYVTATGELKTKPTQQSVQLLRSIGIQPDIIVARSDVDMLPDHVDKIAMYCDVDPAAVIPAPTIKTVYEVPLNFERAGISKILFKLLGWTYKKPDLSNWRQLVKTINTEKPPVRIALAGKYTSLEDAYISVIKAIKGAAYAEGRWPIIEWVDTEKIEQGDKKEWAKLRSVDGVVVPGGFGKRGIEGKIKVAQYCREQRVPYFGLCLGAQIMTVEFARNVLGIKDANSEEFDPTGAHRVVHYLPGQYEGREMGGTLRLGARDCVIKAGTIARKAYSSARISERHRHRYEFNNEYRKQLEAAGLVISGQSPKGQLMEIVEVADHPFMLGTQFHPEFKARPHKVHPLFGAFVQAIVRGAAPEPAKPKAAARSAHAFATR